MKSVDKWNIIVEQYPKLFNENEDKIQDVWESYCSELFDYKRLLKEIDSKRSIQIGSLQRVIPDIILMKDGKDIFDIELKQYNLKFDDFFESQLISYLNQVHLSVGMIVCEKIYLYVYDYQKNNIDKVVIPFEKDNVDGIKLMELITKDTFKEENIKKFVESRIKSAHNVKKIKEEISTDLIYDVLKDFFTKSYSSDEIEKAFSEFEISINSKNSATYSSSNISSLKQNNSAFDIKLGEFAINWCQKKEREGKICFSVNNATRSHNLIRFTTKNMDEYLPADDPRNVAWKNRSYFYEIDFRNIRTEKMWIAIVNKNREDVTNKAKAIYSFCNKDFSENSEYWTAWNTTPVKLNLIADQDTMNTFLDTQFAELMKKEKDFLDTIK